MPNIATAFIKDLEKKSIKFISFCFSDTDGRFQRLTYCTSNVSESLLEEGVGFDGSSIKGWKEIHHSDTFIKPDLSTAFLDPFANESCVCVICDVIDLDTNQPYVRDPRSIAAKAEDYVLSTKMADKIFFGPEMEFFILDDIKFGISPQHTFYHLDSEEGPYNSSQANVKESNLGHRVDFKGGYFPAQPLDKLFNIRAEMVSTLAGVGLIPLLHHHEVAASQVEIGFKYDTLKISADNTQKFKYIIKNVADSFGKTVTFMPKPVFGDNGSGMHTHISLWKDGINLFYEKGKYGDLSQLCLYFIGGIIHHARALNAFTNPTTNSYKRLIPGYEAPVNLAYSSRNRSAAIRIPYSNSGNAKRIELRFPDPSSNPYLAFAAILMAGFDGIKNQISPGDAIDMDLFHLKREDGINVELVCGSLKEAIECLSRDRAFLTHKDVFTDDMIDTYISLKLDEIKQLDATPHPLEFKMYYSC